MTASVKGAAEPSVRVCADRRGERLFGRADISRQLKVLVGHIGGCRIRRSAVDCRCQVVELGKGADLPGLGSRTLAHIVIGGGSCGRRYLARAAAIGANAVKAFARTFAAVTFVRTDSMTFFTIKITAFAVGTIY